METIILPLDINISDAIMSFQESGFQITQKVFDACGKPDYLASPGGRRERRKREAGTAAPPLPAAAAIASTSGGGRPSLSVGALSKKQSFSHCTN